MANLKPACLAVQVAIPSPLLGVISAFELDKDAWYQYFHFLTCEHALEVCQNFNIIITIQDQCSGSKAMLCREPHETVSRRHPLDVFLLQDAEHPLEH